MAGVLIQFFVVLILGYGVKCDVFGFGMGEIASFSDNELSAAPIAGLSLSSSVSMFDKKGTDEGVKELTNAIDKLVKRLEDLDKQKTRLLQECETVTNSAQAAVSTNSKQTVDTSGLATTSELGAFRSKINELKGASKTLESVQTSATSTSGMISDMETALVKSSANDDRINAIAAQLDTNTDRDSTNETIDCPKGFKKVLGHCYGKSTLNTRTSNAHALCTAFGGYLIQVETLDEWYHFQNYIFSVGPESVFIGLSDAIKEGEWVWSRGGKRLNLTNIWSPEQPDNWYNTEHSVNMVYWQGYTFNDLYWANKYGIVCEIGDF